MQYKNKHLLEAPLSTVQRGQLKSLLKAYCRQGGIPDYMHFGQKDYLRSLHESILFRDIMVRYKLTLFLASHCAKEMT